MRLLLLASVGILTGCVSEPTLPTVVQIPIPASCVPADTPEPPAIRSNAELAKLGDGELVLTIAAERLDLLGYAQAASAVIEGCRD